MVQRLRLRTPNAGGTGLIPGQGTKIPHAAQRSQQQQKKFNGITLPLPIISLFNFKY